MVKYDSILTKPYRKRWGKRLVDVKEHLPHKVIFIDAFLFLTPPKGWPTKAKEAPSTHEVRLTAVGNQPSISMS